MIFQGTSVSVAYNRIDKIKNLYYTNADILKDFFNEATVLPVPDDAPDAIPRIMVRTLHEHAQLNISPIAATFEVHYNNGFEKDWRSCEAYILERMTKVFEFLNIFTNNKYSYVGIVSNVLYDKVSTNGSSILIENLLNAKKIRDIYDLNIKYTFVENEKLFVNIILQNARLFGSEINVNKAGSLNCKNQIAETIGSIIDINDRYGFNNIVDYCSCDNVLSELLDSMRCIIDNKLTTLIEKGEY